MAGRILDLLRARLSRGHGGEMARGALAAFAPKVTGVLAGFAFSFFIARFYGAHGSGLYYLPLRVLNILALIGTLGFSTAMVRWIPEYLGRGDGALLPTLYRRVLGLVVPVSGGAGVALFLLAGVLAERVFKDPSLELALRITGVTLPFFVVHIIQSEALRGFKSILASESFRSLFVPACCLILFLALAGAFGGPHLALWVQLAALVMAVFFSGYLLRRRLRVAAAEAAPGGGTAPAPRQMLGLSLPMMMGAFVVLLMGKVDAILIGFFSTTEEVGIYSAAFQLAALASFVSEAVGAIAGPKYAELYWSGRKAELRKVARYATMAMCLTAAPIAGALCVAPELWIGLYGEEFRRGATCLVLLSLSVFTTCAAGFVGLYLNVTGRQVFYRNLILCSLLLNLALNSLLIPRFGATGAAAATLATTLCWNLVGVLYVWRRDGLVFVFPPLLPARKGPGE